MYDGPTVYDRRHEIKIFAGYQIPKIEVIGQRHWRYLSPWPYAADEVEDGRHVQLGSVAHAEPE